MAIIEFYSNSARKYEFCSENLEIEGQFDRNMKETQKFIKLRPLISLVHTSKNVSLTFKYFTFQAAFAVVDKTETVSPKNLAFFKPLLL